MHRGIRPLRFINEKNDKKCSKTVPWGSFSQLSVTPFSSILHPLGQLCRTLFVIFSWMNLKGLIPLCMVLIVICLCLDKLLVGLRYVSSTYHEICCQRYSSDILAILSYMHHRQSAKKPYLRNYQTHKNRSPIKICGIEIVEQWKCYRYDLSPNSLIIFK